MQLARILHTKALYLTNSTSSYAHTPFRGFQFPSMRYQFTHLATESYFVEKLLYLFLPA
jgi:hypothetical protein